MQTVEWIATTYNDLLVCRSTYTVSVEHWVAGYLPSGNVCKCLKEITSSTCRLKTLTVTTTLPKSFGTPHFGKWTLLNASEFMNELSAYNVL